MYALDAISFMELWRSDAGSAVSTPPAYSRTTNRLVVASADLNVHAINAVDGTPAWRVEPTVRTGTATSPLPMAGR